MVEIETLEHNTYISNRVRIVYSTSRPQSIITDESHFKRSLFMFVARIMLLNRHGACRRRSASGEEKRRRNNENASRRNCAVTRPPISLLLVRTVLN